nr:type II toxin-antitoxin system VapC family toxin [uncultured Roseateles sp.]
MASLYLLDTNIVSHMMRNAAGHAMQRVQTLLSQDSGHRLCISVVVQCELLFGLQRVASTRWKARYEEAMILLQVLPLDEAVCAPYASLRAQLERAGTPIGANDSLIAAHALALGATLVTADAEFQRVPGLTVENWLN